MVLPLIDYCAVVWDSCGQGSKSYLDKPFRRADEVSTVFGYPHLQARRNFLKSVPVYKCINRLAPSCLLSVFRHAHQIHSYFTRQISCGCFWLKPPNTRAILGSMGHLPIIPTSLIQDLQRTLIRPSPWRNSFSNDKHQA